MTRRYVRQLVLAGAPRSARIHGDRAERTIRSREDENGADRPDPEDTRRKWHSVDVDRAGPRRLDRLEGRVRVCQHAHPHARDHRDALQHRVVVQVGHRNRRDAARRAGQAQAGRSDQPLPGRQPGAGSERQAGDLHAHPVALVRAQERRGDPTDLGSEAAEDPRGVDLRALPRFGRPRQSGNTTTSPTGRRAFWCRRSRASSTRSTWSTTCSSRSA